MDEHTALWGFGCKPVQLIMEDATIPIPKYFAGKRIFITGGSGFMGKVLIEKLLRSCPDLARIYVLMRPKKGHSPKERLEALTACPLFDIVRETRPENLQKLAPIVGDVAELGLGLADEDRQLLRNEVDLVYHAAASVRFDDPLRSAILLNTRGTREVALLAREMLHLEVFVHISTTYSHTDRKVIDEQTYRADSDWRAAIKVAEETDAHVLSVLTPHCIGQFPNTYTFTKRLAEDVVSDLCNGCIPTCIFRPSIVISTARDPFPGWIDNFNGPVGIFVASGKGILRSMYTNPDLVSDYIPVDLVIKGLIIATWVKGLNNGKGAQEQLQVSVYNASNNSVKSVSNRELVKIGLDIAWEVPLDTLLWYPTGHVTSCYPDHFLRVIFYHLLPALLVDGLLKLTGHKTLLLKIQRKIYIANMALQYFITQEWQFINEKTRGLGDLLVPTDRPDFGYGETNIEPFEYFKNAALGGKKYLLKETGDMERAKKNNQRMYVLHVLFDVAWYIGVIYLVLFKLDIVAVLGHCLDWVYLYFCRI